METTDAQQDAQMPRADAPKPIADLIEQPDYPESLRGQFVDIGGFIGHVIDVVHNSIKVRSLEQTTRSFNFHALKRLYGPREEIPAQPDSREEEAARPVTAPKKPEVELNYAQPIEPIEAFFDRSDYPECILGKHLNISGYHGIVVDIANGSLKVRSAQEVTRSYNASVLKKVHQSKSGA